MSIVKLGKPIQCGVQVDKSTFQAEILTHTESSYTGDDIFGSLGSTQVQQFEVMSTASLKMHTAS